MMPGRLAGAWIVQGPHCKSPDQEVLKLGRNTGGGVVEVPIMMNIHHVLRDFYMSDTVLFPYWPMLFLQEYDRASSNINIITTKLRNVHMRHESFLTHSAEYTALSTEKRGTDTE